MEFAKVNIERKLYPSKELYPNTQLSDWMHL